MIQVTNNVKKFIEKSAGELIIYGAGNAGYWVGSYLDRCNIDFTSYIDKSVDIKSSICNGKPIYDTSKFGEYRERDIRIIITPSAYESALADIIWQSEICRFNALCLVPRYANITTQEDIYHINKLLSYFRGKLLKGRMPTILCNSCLAGRIYELFDKLLLSPTINSGINPRDFIKLCKNPQYYLNQKLEKLYWKRCFGNPGRKSDSPCAMLGDIEICFGHVDSEKGLIERWNSMLPRINWDRMIFLMTEQKNQENIPIQVMKEFFELDGEKLFINTHTFINCGNPWEHIYMPEIYLQNPGSAIENYFDLLGWMNQDYKNKNENEAY